jgi:Tfp pilus assembly protein PilE
MNRKAFTIIEILISMLILFTTVVFVDMTIKAYNTYQRKSRIYQNFYITTLSIKDWLYNQDFSKKNYEGKMNGVDFKAKIELLIQKPNYEESLEGISGNVGNFMISLYKVTLTLKYKEIERKFSYFVTKQKIINPVEKEDFL